MVRKDIADLDSYLSERVACWPFRLLAAILVGAGLLALIQPAFSAIIRHDPRSAAFEIAILPVPALLIRSAGFAVISGRLIANPLWPFASGRVFYVWAILAFLVLRFI